jgi:hypothetical protein
LVSDKGWTVSIDIILQGHDCGSEVFISYSDCSKSIIVAEIFGTRFFEAIDCSQKYVIEELDGPAVSAFGVHSRKLSNISQSSNG